MTFTPEQLAQLQRLKREIVQELAIMLRPLLDRLDTVRRVGNHAEEEEHGWNESEPTASTSRAPAKGSGDAKLMSRADEAGLRLRRRLRQREQRQSEPRKSRSAAR